MDKFEFCKVAHEHKDELVAIFEKEHRLKEDFPEKNKDPQTIEEWIWHIAKAVDYLKYKELCKDTMQEATMEAVWEPVNAKIKEATTEHAKTIEYLDHSKMSHSEFTERIKGKDIHAVMNTLAEFIDTLNTVDPVKYRALMSELDRI